MEKETVNLGNLAALMQPMKTENGRYIPQPSQKAAGLSLKLAELAYTQETDAWREAGWRDVSYHIDHKLLTGEAANNSGGLAGVISEYKQFMSRMRAQTTNIISQVLGTVRNRDESDTCKAVVMIHKTGPEKYLVAIGFMGTGKRVFDWLANFRIGNQEGMHQGCLQLTQSFEENLPNIVFQETARELNMEKITLQDILQECRRPDSRLKIWMAGHSQGGAVMQLFAYRAISRGVLRKNMIGYGFASPSVLFGHSRMDVQSVPLFHLINEDDLVPRQGAQLHVGQCLLYRSTEKMRMACYGPVWDSEGYRKAFSLVQRVRNTEDTMVMLIALFRALQALSNEATVQAASELLGRLLPEKLVALLGGRMEDGLKAMQRYVEKSYRRATEKEQLPEGKIGVYQSRINRYMEAYGARVFIKCLMQVIGLPHRIREKDAFEQTMPAYVYLAGEGFAELSKGIMPRYAYSLPRGEMPRKRPKGRFEYAKRRQSASVRRHTGSAR